MNLTTLQFPQPHQVDDLQREHRHPNQQDLIVTMDPDSGGMLPETPTRHLQAVNPRFNKQRRMPFPPRISRKYILTRRDGELQGENMNVDKTGVKKSSGYATSSSNIHESVSRSRHENLHPQAAGHGSQIPRPRKAATAKNDARAERSLGGTMSTARSSGPRPATRNSTRLGSVITTHSTPTLNDVTNAGTNSVTTNGTSNANAHPKIPSPNPTPNPFKPLDHAVLRSKLNHSQLNRYNIFAKDEAIVDFNEEEVLCRRCGDNRRMEPRRGLFYRSNWNKHLQVCVAIKEGRYVRAKRDELVQYLAAVE
ncbi:hypothetical protein D9758_015547 [Tetrapyrgos nigripes]|uniref:Uncharacterized protein n=1 Tax=Tetrapyrgos nigripes TaxID=182062 RepID=A0A8H5C303_9AGAR|nr:hypothetical protein D9758_015547 [Tetrapyrgos nigripes]